MEENRPKRDTKPKKVIAFNAKRQLLEFDSVSRAARHFDTNNGRIVSRIETGDSLNGWFFDYLIPENEEEEEGQ